MSLAPLFFKGMLDLFRSDPIAIEVHCLVSSSQVIRRDCAIQDGKSGLLERRSFVCGSRTWLGSLIDLVKRLFPPQNYHSAILWKCRIETVALRKNQKRRH